jgi:hypothetical protein
MWQESVILDADTQLVGLSSGNQENMLPKLSDFIGNEPSAIKKVKPHHSLRLTITSPAQ